MKLWELELNDWDYDDVISCVVLARSEDEARETAAKWAETPDEDGHEPGGSRPEIVARDYRDPERSTCVVVEWSAEPRVVHWHRRHG
jgi:hypothetical protein